MDSIRKDVYSKSTILNHEIILLTKAINAKVNKDDCKNYNTTHFKHFFTYFNSNIIVCIGIDITTAYAIGSSDT